MRILIIIMLLFAGLSSVHAQQKLTPKQKQQQTNTKLALAFYNSKDYEKAAPLLLEVYKVSRNNYYFRLYITSLLELKEYDRALEQIQTEIEKQKNTKPSLYINWGYVLKAQDKVEEAEEKYRKALQNIPSSKGSYLVTASTFLQWREVEWAKKTYLQGR